MKGEQENMPSVDRVAIVVEIYGTVCQLYSRLRNDSGDIKALSPQSIYRYVLLYIVDNAGIHGIDLGREGLILNDLSFFSY